MSTSVTSTAAKTSSATTLITAATQQQQQQEKCYRPKISTFYRQDQGRYFA